ncbi:MAG: 1-acyl-sn-glycerol-3-phosphate acyltransferase [Gammaproteobacteria bacterium]|nr:1-acyl-sn-glycerol-3-phosphate acyltransferase [Gammaproteobacteria bacterium]
MNAIAETSRVARLNEVEILENQDFLDDLSAVAERMGTSNVEAFERAKECLEEMATRPEDRYLDRVARLARFMYSRSYEPDLDVDTVQLDRLKELSKEHPLVFLWSHKSHLDSFVFMRAIYDSNFRPQPLSFAGINMAFAGFKTLAKRSGAIFLRRSFRDDDIYKLVFRHYIDYLVGQRVPLSWSIEGTRSRTGKLMPPKLGLIQWVIESYQRASCDDALLVPVSISFDQIAEMDDYVAMQQGVPKRKESLGWFISYISGMKARVGKIYLRCGEPVPLSESVHVSDAMFDERGKPERTHVQKLAFEVMSRIEHVTPVSITDLVTLVLLAGNGTALTENQIRAHAQEIIALIEKRGIPTASDLSFDSGAELGAALAAMATTGLMHRYDEGGNPVYRVTPGKELAAAYYRNTIIHYFLSSAVAEMALAMLRGGTESPDSPHEAALTLRDLFKFEFFFKTKDDFEADVDWYLDERYPEWRAALASHRPVADMLFDEQVPLFGHSIMRSFVEAYHVVARVLKRHPEREFSDERDFVRLCMKQGEEMLLRKQIGSASALSEPLFATAMRLADYRGLLTGVAGEDDPRREQFAVEIADAVRAVDLLQERYDQHQEMTCDS